MLVAKNGKAGPDADSTACQISIREAQPKSCVAQVAEQCDRLEVFSSYLSIVTLIQISEYKQQLA